MKNRQPLDLITLFKNKLGDVLDDFTLPPPIFTMMACEVIEYNEVEKSLTVKIPINTEWLYPKEYRGLGMSIYMAATGLGLCWI